MTQNEFTGKEILKMPKIDMHGRTSSKTSYMMEDIRDEQGRKTGMKEKVVKSYDLKKLTGMS